MKYPEPEFFRPKNPNKYMGDSRNIVARSNIEKRYMKFWDEHPDIVKWASEELFVRYVSPVDRQPHRYFPDFIVKTKSNKVFMIEIKPESQRDKPKKNTKKNQKRLLKEMIDWSVNEAKWNAAKKFCENHGWEFLVLTDKEIRNIWQQP